MKSVVTLHKTYVSLVKYKFNFCFTTNKYKKRKRNMHLASTMNAIVSDFHEVSASVILVANHSSPQLCPTLSAAHHRPLSGLFITSKRCMVRGQPDVATPAHKLQLSVPPSLVSQTQSWTFQRWSN